MTRRDRIRRDATGYDTTRQDTTRRDRIQHDAIGYDATQQGTTGCDMVSPQHKICDNPFEHEGTHVHDEEVAYQPVMWVGEGSTMSDAG